MNFKKKLYNVILIHENNDNILKKKYKNYFIKKLILSKNLIIYLKLITLKINNLLKKKIKKLKLIVLLIWNSGHFKDILKILKFIVKVNTKIYIKIFKNLGNFKKFKKLLRNNLI